MEERENARVRSNMADLCGFSGLRTVSYVPQIARIAKDRNGASAISYPTWLLWSLRACFHRLIRHHEPQ